MFWAPGSNLRSPKSSLGDFAQKEYLVHCMQNSRQTNKSNQLDPLYVIFEQHLYHFEDSNLDRTTFIDHVLHDYFSYLRKKNITVPKSLEKSIYEELFIQIQTMLVKKIYGCLTIQDYQKKLPVADKKRVKARYSRLVKKA